jgi:Zn-dependent peptidase ImmA (M78 family)
VLLAKLATPGLLSMVDIPVNKDVLVWARKLRGLSELEAAKRLKLTADQLSDLESGAEQSSPRWRFLIAWQPSIKSRLLVMMPEALPALERPADFRTYDGKKLEWDENLLLALEVVNAQVDFFVELREQNAGLFTDVTPRSYEAARAPNDVAAEERQLFRLTLETQFSWPTSAQAFRYWRHIIERAGVFVQIMDLGPENLCRGFAVYDERAIPAIVINGDDSDGPARTFTLLHEYAYILIGKPGVSDQNRKNSVERWCNQFAAHLMMPADRFKADASAIDPSKTWSDTAIRKIADLYRVSMSAVALHLEDVGLAKPGSLRSKIIRMEEAALFPRFSTHSTPRRHRFK